MKKIIVILFLFTLCVGLCACSGSGAATTDSGSENSVTLPTKPQQIDVPNLPALNGIQGAETGEEAESTDPTGETYPWEAEFREEDYKQFQGELCDVNEVVTGTFITWAKNSPFEPSRTLNMHNNGDIEDIYYGYPNSDFPSHDYFYGADGTYGEFHYLDNGHYDEASDVSYWGTTIYYKIINPDGSFTECECDENGNVIQDVQAEANGYYSESLYYENGNIKKSICNDPVTGEYWEQECFENGNAKKCIFAKAAAGIYTEQEYYENGSFKYNRDKTPEYSIEERYDEDGYRTYYHSKNANYEIELIADDTGKLVKAIENGVEIEDPAALAQYASSCNFRE